MGFWRDFCDDSEIQAQQTGLQGSLSYWDGVLHGDYPAELRNLFVPLSILGLGFMVFLSDGCFVIFNNLFIYMFILDFENFFLGFLLLLLFYNMMLGERKKVAMRLTSSLFWNESWGESLAESNLLLQPPLLSNLSSFSLFIPFFFHVNWFVFWGEREWFFHGKWVLWDGFVLFFFKTCFFIIVILVVYQRDLMMMMKQNGLSNTWTEIFHHSEVNPIASESPPLYFI